MRIGILQIELRILSPRSLKEKRSIIKPMKNYLRKQFNISVAEIDHHDVLKSSKIVIAMVGRDQTILHRELYSISQKIENRYPVIIIKESLEIL